MSVVPVSPASARTAFAPGKVILLGEHAVVDGHPGVAAALPRGVTATARPASSCRLGPLGDLAEPHAVRLRCAFARMAQRAGHPGVDVTFASNLPIGAGLGSSAATAVACARVLLDGDAGDQEVFDLAQVMEKDLHGSASGLDAACALHGGVILWTRGRETPHALRCPVPLGLVIAIDGERPPTGETVAAIRRAGDASLLGEIGEIAHLGAEAIEAGDLDTLGALLSLNHEALVVLGITDVRNAALVDRMLRAGALGAKVTGAGGGGGAVVGLARHPHRLAAELRRDGIAAFAAEVRS